MKLMMTAALAATMLAPTAVVHPDRPDLRVVMEELVDAGITGVQLRVRDQHGEWAGSAGVSRIGAPAPPPTDGRFRVGSATKTFTATVLLQLVAEGRVGLDDPVDRHLPRLGLDRRITVRMLLQHTSGLSNYTGEYYEDGTVVPGITWSGRDWVESRFRTYRPAQLVRAAQSIPPRFEPGATWHYSNTNYTIALMLIERITGHGYAEEVSRRIVRPLGLTGTVAPGTSPEIPGPHAHAYYRYPVDGRTVTIDITRQNPSWATGAGDIISTTADLRTFITALMDGRLLPPALLAEMRTPNASGYGLGLFVLNVCGVTLVNHNGGVQGYATLMYATPDGRRTLTGSLTYVDDAEVSKAGVFADGLAKLLKAEFC
jgi:D-alanyl-D-alanine carboxypeptidase